MKKLLIALIAVITVTFYNCSNDQLNEAPESKTEVEQIYKANIFYIEFIYNKGKGIPERNPGNYIVHCSYGSYGQHRAVWQDENGVYYHSMTWTDFDGIVHTLTEKVTFRSVSYLCQPATNKAEKTQAQLATEKFIKLQKSGKQLVLGRNGGAISIVCQQVGHLGDNEDVVQTKTTIWQDEYGTYWETFSWGDMIHSTLKVADQSLSGAYAAC